MIHLQINNHEFQMELRGSDDKILEELSSAAVRMLTAMEQSDGRCMKENLALLVMKMLEKSKQEADFHEKNTYPV